MADSNQSADIAARAADYATTASLDAAPESVRNRVPIVILDTLGVCIRGGATDYVQQAAEGLATLGRGRLDSGGGTVFATGDRHDVSLAALLNAAGGTTLELDEGNQDSAHPGIHTVVPAIAAGQHLNVSKKQLFDAVLVGYEVGARLGDVIRPLKSGLHPHGGWAAVSGSVAVGRLKGFEPETMAHAIRNAVNPFLIGHWQAAYEGATIRDFYTGLSCQHGIVAASLAESGVTGVHGAIEDCLLPYTAADISAEAAIAPFETLGESSYLTESYVKMHAACRYTHAPIEAIAEIQRRTDFDTSDITEITVETFELGTTLDQTTPKNVLSAKFSTPFAIATRLITGESGPEAFSPERVADADTQALAERVKLIQADEFEKRARDGVWGATVTVETRNGSQYTETVPDARGGGDNPFTDEEIVEKFDSLVTSRLSAEKATELRQRILHADKNMTVDEMIAPAIGN